jgi:VanZ family protein
LPAIFFAVTIFMFSSRPGKEISDSYDSLSAAVRSISPASSQQAPASSPKVDWLKVGHGIGYFCLGFTVLYALTARSRWSPLAALVICSLYAITDELHQAMVPGRSAAGRDVLLDSLAALTGIIILSGIMKWKSRATTRQGSAG